MEKIKFNESKSITALIYISSIVVVIDAYVLNVRAKNGTDTQVMHLLHLVYTYHIMPVSFPLSIYSIVIQMQNSGCLYSINT